MSTMARIPLLALLALACPLAAQDGRLLPNFRVDLSFGGGSAEHRTDGSGLDGDTDAGFFRIQFEGFSDRGLGGGVRIEGWQSDDDLFAGTDAGPTEATSSALFGHFSFLIEDSEFRMPLRIGLLFHGHVLRDTATDEEITFTSGGPQFELAPEVFLNHDPDVKWSLYSEIGFAIAGTTVEVDGDSNEYDSSSWMYGFELGTRVYFDHLEFGLAYVSRGQTMDESDPEGLLYARGYDASFDGLLFTIGAVF